MNITEALADCIMRFEGWLPPGNISNRGSTSWRNRNPGNLRESPYKIAEDANGYTVFESMTQGWGALILDLNTKLNGHSSHKLTPQNTLNDLFKIYAPALDHNDPQQYSKIVSGWLNQIYNTNLITPDTKLEDLLKFK